MLNGYAWAVAAFVLGIATTFVVVHFTPMAKLDRLERDAGLDRTSVWLLTVATWGLSVFATYHGIQAGYRPSIVERATGYGPLTAGSVAIATGMYLVGQAGAAIGTYRRLQGLEKTAVAEATPGLVALTGRVVVTEGTVEAPFAGAPAVVSQSTVFEPADDLGAKAVETPGEVNGWIAAGLFAESAPFALEDDTGRVRVDPAGARFKHLPRERVHVAGDEEPPRRIGERFLTSQELNDTTRHRRYEDRLLAPGERVSVVGTLEDGIVAAPAAAAGRVRRSPPFVISTGSLSELVDAYRLRIGRGVGGCCLVLGGLLVLLYGTGAA